MRLVSVASPSRLLLVVGVLLLGVVSGKNEEQKDLITLLVEWFKEHGGLFHPQLEIRRADPNDSTSRFAMFATGDISEDELLLEIPRKVLLTDEGYENDSYGDHGIWCPTAYRLIDELKKGEDSFYGPYINYLLSQEQGQLPSHWSDAGKQLLLEVLAQDDALKDNDLKPRDAVGWVEKAWHGDCKGGNDRFEQHAALMLLQRGWDDIMIPVYDMMSHRNGPYLNTKSNSVHKKTTPVRVHASRDIKAGEELYTSYNNCKDCGNRINNGYGTPEILRDFGFVELYPQRWYFGRRLYFDLIQDPEDKTITVKWMDKKPKKKALNWMAMQLERLQDIYLGEKDIYSVLLKQVPPHELRVIEEYHQAAMNAMTHALEYWGRSVKKCDPNDATCAMQSRYDELDFRPDLMDYNVDTCDTSVSLNFKGFKKLDDLNSHYQHMEFFQDPKNFNTCFELTNIVQMCGSYRPHYHEMVVHYTARFLPDVRRVVWVGGGDSMLLHEILKYPNLELAVGLELDQYVTRLSFKHFGTQPHFDHPKVQWWYGDAAKSLLMLPQDYFGSFDMVLVDMSETVMSLTVTEGLDIFHALRLLLKPEGIFVKNELYMEKMADLFRYATQIHFSDVPVVCSQCLILGSNQVDFFARELTDHKIDNQNLYVKPLAEISDRYQFWHDYRHNVTSLQNCRDPNEKDVEPTEQIASPGILMVLEAEDVSMDMKDPEMVLHAITRELEQQGLHRVSSTVTSSLTGSTLGVILSEGYIIVRTWLDEKYCAIDIHLWSSFDKHEAAKTALVQTLGSKSVSSYRIVAGGMFGVPTWKEDEKQRGPRVTEVCSVDEQKTRTTPVKVTVANTMLEETMKLIKVPDNMLFAVLCGEKKQTCQFADFLKKKSKVRVLPLYACSGVENEFKEGAFDKMLECEKEVFETLLDSVPSGDSIGGVLIDLSAPITFSRIAYKVFKQKKSRLFKHDMFVMTVLTKQEEEWRRNMMERFRKDIITYEPNFRTETLFNSTDGSIELGVTSSGDWDFVSHWAETVKAIEKRTGFVSDTRDIRGGLYIFYEDWKPDPFFLPEDYDQRSPLEQYKLQQPVGYQTVFQLEPNKSKTSFSLSPLFIINTLKETMSNIESVTWQEAQELDKAEMHQFNGLGDGFVVVSLWAGGNCVFVWDGRQHMDVNLFTYKESKAFANEFIKLFKSHFPKKLTTTLRDVQPRGYGRVVNFLKDIGSPSERSDPHWARFKESK